MKVTPIKALDYLRSVKKFVKVSSIETALKLPSGSLRKALDNEGQTSYKYEDKVAEFVEKVLLYPSRRIKDEDINEELVRSFFLWCCNEFGFSRIAPPPPIEEIERVYDFNKIVWTYLDLDRESFYDVERAIEIVLKFKVLYSNFSNKTTNKK
jgi:hypothetical protein